MSGVILKKVVILVDGGFYRRVAKFMWGEKSPEERASELIKYCHLHLKDRENFAVRDGKKIYKRNELYRIFYYDCKPLDKTIYNPLSQKNINFSKSQTYIWMNKFLDNLKNRRKVALRMGFFADEEMNYIFTPETVKKICRKAISVDDISENDLILNMRQKGVDMKIGVDIASLAYKKLVEQVVLISGDSDFVPAAKLARVEGIDFILDSLGMKVNDNLSEHIDGLRSYCKYFKNKETTVNV